MAPGETLRWEVEKSPSDEHGNKVTIIKCHGRLIAENAGQIREVVKPLIPEGGRIVIDVGDVIYLDSSGLGTLLGLKVSAIRQGFCVLELANLTPRIKELLQITNLANVFSS
jgi:anti-anti-sigma factor